MLGRFLRKRGTFLHFSDILYPAKEHRPLDLARKDAMILHETYLKNPEFANIQKISGKLLGAKVLPKQRRTSILSVGIIVSLARHYSLLVSKN